MNLKNLTNDNLIIDLKKLVSEERKITTEILHHLREIESRKLHLARGFSSLFDYATKDLGYSESQAQRRIQAMRLIKDLPQAEIKIKEGTLSLTNAARIQSFIFQSIKEKKPLSSTQKLELVSQMENKSSRQCEQELIKLNPGIILIREKERPLDKDHLELKLVIKKDLKEKLDYVKGLLSHKIYNTHKSFGMPELLDVMCEMIIKQKDLSKGENLRSFQEMRRGVSTAPKMKTS